MKKKIIIDSIMLVLMLLVFSKAFLAAIYHEIIGVILLILFIIHLILNITYIKSIFKGNFKAKGIIMLFINIIFFITFLASIILGVLSSQELLKFLNVGSFVASKLHKIISYICIVVLGIHLGVNFNFMFGKIEKIIKNNIIKYFISVLIIAYGIYSFIRLKLFYHIIGTYQFGVVEGNIYINVIRYFFVIMMFTIIMNYLYKKIKN